MELNEMMDKVHWLGHDSFRIDGEQVVYVDPYDIEPGQKADLILITHVHHDHCSPEDIAKIYKEDTVIVTEKDSAANLQGDIRVARPGDAMVIGGIAIQAVPAYNTNKNFHPRANDWLGFILETQGVKIYHAGDTDFIPEMESVQADVAFLPVGGTYTCDALEAAKAANTIKPKAAVPIHFGSVVGTKADADTFIENLDEGIKGVILLKE